MKNILIRSLVCCSFLISILVSEGLSHEHSEPEQNDFDILSAMDCVERKIADSGVDVTWEDVCATDFSVVPSRTERAAVVNKALNNFQTNDQEYSEAYDEDNYNMFNDESEDLYADDSIDIPEEETGDETISALNKMLPDWIRMQVQLRHRYEFRDNFNFNDSVDDQDGFHLYRARVNTTLIPHENVKLFHQFQDSRISNGNFTNKRGFEDYAETRQLYLEVNNIKPAETIEIGSRLGRQELSYGAQRLIGGFNWSNVAQSFDAGKIMLNVNPMDLTIDFFGGTAVPIKSPREFNDLFEDNGDDLVRGYYAVLNPTENLTLEQYFINRDTQKSLSFGPSGSAPVDEYTMGGRIKGKFGSSGFDYEMEVAKQWGDFGLLDIDALMGVAIFGYTFDHDWKPRIAFEYDYASGDNDSSDGTRKTFDNLFPTNHLYYGYMDRASLQNLNNYRVQLSVKPTEKLMLQTDLHFIYLDTSKDAFYGANRAVVRTATGTDVNTHVGNEVDLLAKYQMTDYLQVLLGYSHFFPQSYLRKTGADDDGDFFYVQSLFSF